MRDFEQVYESQKMAIFVFVLGILRVEQEAQEVTQEAFLALYKELQKGTLPIAESRPWLFRVAKNKALNAKRDRREIQLPWDEERGTMKTSGVPLGVGPGSARSDAPIAPQIPETPESLLSRKQEQVMVGEALDKMKEREATLLRLYSAGLSYNEIADMMGMEKKSISKALLRAKHSFRKYYHMAFASL